MVAYIIERGLETSLYFYDYDYIRRGRLKIFDNNYISGKTIEEAWRLALWCCVRNGYDYVVEKGSYEGQIRRQLPYVVIRVEEPWTRPLAPLIPKGIPPVTVDTQIEKYFMEYILGTHKSDNHDYTYGEFISQQIEKAINLLNISRGGTNQVCITIGNEKSILLKDPPCLRVITFKVIDNKLQMAVFFRSWDLFTGLPENLGGLQLLKEFVLAWLNFKVDDGPIVAFSDGLHIYEQYFDLVDLLNVEKINAGR